MQVAIELSNFLAIESCARCAACKLGCTAITELLRLIEAGEAAEHHLDAIADRLPHITDQTRCALPAGEQLLTGSLLTDHRDEFIAHLGRTCDSEVTERVPKIEHLDDATGEVAYDPDYHRKRAD